jgi:hypothetical protein
MIRCARDEMPACAGSAEAIGDWLGKRNLKKTAILKTEKPLTLNQRLLQVQ